MHFTFLSGERYCCMDSGCNFGHWERAQWRSIRRDLRELGGGHLGLVVIPFGIVALVIGRYRDAAARRANDERNRIAPFLSFADLRAARRAIPDFRKRRLPPEVATRHIRSRLMASCVTVQGLPLAPIMLLLLAIPREAGEFWVELPQPASDPPDHEGAART